MELFAWKVTFPTKTNSINNCCIILFRCPSYFSHVIFPKWIVFENSILVHWIVWLTIVIQMQRTKKNPKNKSIVLSVHKFVQNLLLVASLCANDRHKYKYCCAMEHFSMFSLIHGFCLTIRNSLIDLHHFWKSSEVHSFPFHSALFSNSFFLLISISIEWD